jgi:hypothetical protein
LGKLVLRPARLTESRITKKEGRLRAAFFMRPCFLARNIVALHYCFLAGIA